MASDLLVSSSYDMTVRIWELSAGREALCLQGHTDQVRDDKSKNTREASLGHLQGHNICLSRFSAWLGARMGRSWQQ